MTIDHDAIARAQAAIENGLIEALQSQAQADMDGTTVIVSRQACDEAAEFLPALYDEVKRLRAERDRFEAALGRASQVGGTTYLVERAEKAEAERDRLRTQCCMCGKTGLSTIEDGGPECELDDGRWVCSVECYDRAVPSPLGAEAERDRLRAALDDIAAAASGIAHDLQIGPDDEGRDIYEMALAIRDDAREALKGNSDA